MPEKRRPFSVTLLVWMVLLLTAWGAFRFAASLRWWDVLSEFESSLSAAYLWVTGAGWGAAGGVLVFGLLRRKQWAAPGAVVSIPLWLTEYWIERLFFETSRANLPFALTGSVLVIALAWTLANLPGTKSYFAQSEAHEQPVEKSDTA
ncbi:MAG: hypothetical protein Kow0070_04160 [Anaerolineales bacterium]